jgi:RNA polymerase sigma-70 factor, ECF subfamily
MGGLMGEGSTASVTELLVAWNGGDEAALERLVPVVYAELHRLARRHLARERKDAPQTTALVHEAHLRLVDQRSVRWENRAHFYAIAARMMRRILIDHARARGCERRGGGAPHVPLEEAAEVSVHRGEQLVALDEALGRLAEIDSRKSRVVEMRFFGGMSVEETAAALGVSTVTVMRDWSTAKAWLHREMAGPASGPEP